MTTTMYEYTQDTEWRVTTQEIPAGDNTPAIPAGTIFPRHIPDGGPYHFEGEVMGSFIDEEGRWYFTLVEDSEVVTDDVVFAIESWFEPMGWVVSFGEDNYRNVLDAKVGIQLAVQKYWDALKSGNLILGAKLLPMRIVVRRKANDNYTVIP